MPEATLSSKYQVTLPMEIVRALRLKGGDKLVVTLIDDHVVLMPKPASWAQWASSRPTVIYGQTRREIDRYVAEERASWERGSGTAELTALLAGDPLVRRIYTALARQPLGRNGLVQEIGPHEGLEQALQKLMDAGAIRAVPLPGAPGPGGQVVYQII